jgi:DNA-binding response OmpR family regulator
LAPERGTSLNYPETAGGGLGVKILVIDDEPSVIDALELILREKGYEVVTALNGRDGLSRARSGSIDVTISDVRLPDMSGLEVAVELLRFNAASPVILMSAHSTPELVAEGLRLGAIGVLAKPFSLATLLRLIHKSVSRGDPRG